MEEEKATRFRDVPLSLFGLYILLFWIIPLILMCVSLNVVEEGLSLMEFIPWLS